MKTGEFVSRAWHQGRSLGALEVLGRVGFVALVLFAVGCEGVTGSVLRLVTVAGIVGVAILLSARPALARRLQRPELDWLVAVALGAGIMIVWAATATEVAFSVVVALSASIVLRLLRRSVTARR